MSVLDIRLFGGLDIACDSSPIISIPSVMSRSLLAYLVTYRHQSHTRALLAGTFWPELSEARASRRLSQTLWQIRKLLRPHPIFCIQGDAIQLNPDLPLQVDREEFLRYQNLSTGENSQSIQYGEACLKIYRGEFMAGYYQDWTLAEREHLREAYLIVLGRLVSAYKLSGEYEQALRRARLLTIEDPWNEANHREVMRLCHLSDRRAEARQQYQVCRQKLAELGEQPSAETKALLAEIERQVGNGEIPWLPRASQTSPAPMLERPDHLPLVGRQSELAWLLSRAEAAAHGQGGLILLFGEAGVGKTHLLQELDRNLGWRGMTVAWGRCYELAGPPAYQPLVEILRSQLPALSQSSLEPIWRRELHRLLPELAVNEHPAELRPDEEQNRLLEAIKRSFQALSRVAPCVAILEDAHWMDPASLAAIRFLLPHLSRMTLLVVVSARGSEISGEQNAAFSALENTRLPRCLRMEPLNLDETGELVQRCLELEKPPAKFSARLYAETEGNPFFLTETLRSLLEEGLLFRDEGGKWSTPWDEDSSDYDRMPLPRGVAQSVQRRLERLPIPAREALNLAAVIGRGLPFELWRQASDLSETELWEIADELCRHALLQPADARGEAGLTAMEDYVFTHDQIRRVTYESLPPHLLRIYHRRVAEVMGNLAPHEIEALAYHWTEAGVWPQAAACHRQAGQRAAAVYANSEAVGHYRSALLATQQLPGESNLPTQYDIHLALEKLFSLQGDRHAQAQELEALSQMAEKLGDDSRLAWVAYRRARFAEITSDFPAAMRHAALAVELASQTGETAIQAQSTWEWGWTLLLQGEHTAARPHFETALQIARSAKLAALEADALHGLGTICLVTGAYAQAREYYAQVINISQRVDIQPRAARTLANLGNLATIQGDHQAAKIHNEEALEILRQIGDQRGASIVIQNLADEFLAEGNFVKALAHYQEALEIQTAVRARENISVTLRNLGLLYHQLGNYTRAKGYYEQALEVAQEAGVRWYVGQALAYLSLWQHHQGDHHKAVELSWQGLNIAREIDDRLALGWLLDVQGHALSELGQEEEAEKAYREALDLHGQMGENHKACESLAGLARLALGQGQLMVALEYVEKILSIQAKRGLGGAFEPFRVRLTCWLVLEACHDRRAREVLSLAYGQLQSWKANIQDEELECSFLENVMSNRQIVTAYQALAAQRQKDHLLIDLPRLDAPGGRPLRAGETIPVQWTLADPQDELISGKAARRRQRLCRLLAEAQQQGAAPSIQHLARALGVDRRTIQRDLKALSAQKIQLPPTRGKMSHKSD